MKEGLGSGAAGISHAGGSPLWERKCQRLPVCQEALRPSCCAQPLACSSDASRCHLERSFWLVLRWPPRRRAEGGEETLGGEGVGHLQKVGDSKLDTPLPFLDHVFFWKGVNRTPLHLLGGLCQILRRRFGFCPGLPWGRGPRAAAAQTSESMTAAPQRASPRRLGECDLATPQRGGHHRRVTGSPQPRGPGAGGAGKALGPVAMELHPRGGSGTHSTSLGF